MKKALIVSAVVASLATGIGSLAWAGYKTTYNVYVSTSGLYANGAMGDARAVSGTSQYIGCNASYTGSGSPFIQCSAYDGTNYAYCVGSDASFLNVMQTMTGNSYIYFAYNSSSVCTYLEIGNDSYMTPIQP
jgi:hypothetical protein